MKSEFKTDLIKKDITDKIFELHVPLIYGSELLKCTVIIPAGFQSDGASVPRMPIAYQIWGNRAHREAVLHDYLYRKDATPDVTCSLANEIFFEAMKATGKAKYIYYPMWWGVVIGGWTAYKKKNVMDAI